MIPDDDAISFADYLERLAATEPDRVAQLERLRRHHDEPDTQTGPDR